MTSAECLKALQEKENVKKPKAEEKEEREKEREFKKKVREEELKRKKEERDRKAAMKEAKLLEQQSKKTRGKQSKRKSNTPDVIADNTTPNAEIDDPPADVTTGNPTNNACSNKGTLKRKSKVSTQSNAQRSKQNADDEIDVNRCCVCFGMYADDAGTGREWLECQCFTKTALMMMMLTLNSVFFSQFVNHS